MGHVQQHEKYGHTGANTNQSILEYHNVLLNENKLDGPLRDKDLTVTTTATAP